MGKEQLFVEVIQDILTERKNGALYVTIVETSEDILRIYIKDGQIYHLRYGSAIGKDCLDILDYYNLYSATFFEGIKAPDKPHADTPSTKEILTKIGQMNKKVRVT
jgi:hypothetical protein